MKLLAFDTCGDACSVAVAQDGKPHEIHRIAPRRQADLLLPMIEEVLATAGWGFADLDGIAFGRGPGAFTGVRISAAVCQGLAFARDLPVVPVSSLLAMAAGVAREHAVPAVIAAFDARMGEVYLTAVRFDAGLPETVVAECVAPPAEVPLPELGPWVGAGSAFASYADVLGRRLGDRLTAASPQALPRAGDVLNLARPVFDAGNALPAEQAMPVYLRDRVAERPARMGG